MPHIYLELSKDSRRVGVTNTSIEEKFVAAICLDPLIITTTLGADFLGSDEDVIATEFAYSIFPLIRLFPDYQGTVRVLVLKDLHVEVIVGSTWKVEVTYTYDLKTGTGGEEPNENGVLPYIKYSFAIGGGTKHILRADELISGVLATDSPLPDVPENKLLAIGRTDDSIEGTEVPNSELRIQITAYFLPITIDLDYLWTIVEVMAGEKNKGSTNDAVFIGGEPGEVQLTAFSGGGTIVDIIPLSFDFHLARNLDEVEDEGFKKLTMEGHDILDYFFLHEFDEDNSKKVLLQPTARYVLRVASKEDYTRLLLPVAQEEA